MQKLFPAEPIVKLDDDLWILSGRLGYPLMRNMIIWRMPDGGLFLHSLVGLDDAGFAGLESLGKPAIAVVPSQFHQMDAPLYRRRYPELRILAPAMARERISREAGLDGTVEEFLPALGIGMHEVPAVKVAEHVYELPLAAGGRALIANDVFTNGHTHDRSKPFARWPVAMFSGTGGKLGIARIYRWRVVLREDDLRRFAQRLADLPGIRIMTFSHGEPIMGDVSAALKSALG